MSEIPMPGGYSPSSPPPQQREGFCGRCCQNTCMAVGICCAVIIILFFFVMMTIFGSFPFFFGF